MKVATGKNAPSGRHNDGIYAPGINTPEGKMYHKTFSHRQKQQHKTRETLANEIKKTEEK